MSDQEDNNVAVADQAEDQEQDQEQEQVKTDNGAEAETEDNNDEDQSAQTQAQKQPQQQQKTNGKPNNNSGKQRAMSKKAAKAAKSAKPNKKIITIKKADTSKNDSKNKKKDAPKDEDNNDDDNNDDANNDDNTDAAAAGDNAEAATTTKANGNSEQKTAAKKEENGAKGKSNGNKNNKNNNNKNNNNNNNNKNKTTNSKSKEEDKNKDGSGDDGDDDSKEEDYRFSTGVLVSNPTSRDVKIGNFSLMSYGKELIKDTTIELTIGRRYGLIGPNGSGKSTFLKCLAKREVPIPDFIDIFYLDEEAPPTDQTPLEAVLADAEAKVKVLEDAADRAMELHGPDSEIVQDLYDRLDKLDPKTFKARAGKILHGLGFDKKMSEKKTKDMSGGWRMRVALAQALFVRPTLLLLDEPTNHLDLEACVWLEKYLNSYDRCLVVISHSQDFLNGVCTNIIHITPQQKLQGYGGNYDMFVQTRLENEINQMKRYKKQQDDIAHLKSFISSAGTYANLVRQAKSKQKIIDKMVEDGLVEKVAKESTFDFRFTNVEVLLPPTLAFYKVAFAYSGDMKDALYSNLDLGVNMDSRIALVGPNGAGKSTLIKLMAGDLYPTQGIIKRHIDLVIGRYHQHSIEQLDNSSTPLEFLMKKYEDKKMAPETWRQFLGKYGVRSEMQTTKIGKLSDGQKSRLVFALIGMTKPHILLLDEPTNHLDMECIDSLADAINNYNGGMVLVSHDFRLISQVAKEIWVCDKKTLTPWKGDIQSYKASLMQKMEI